MAKNFNGKRVSILSNIKATYIHLYPADEMGKDLNEHISFAQLLASIEEGENVYKTLNVEDSIVRERIFTLLAVVAGVQYDDIYTRWLNSEELKKKWDAIKIPF